MINGNGVELLEVTNRNIIVGRLQLDRAIPSPLKQQIKTMANNAGRQAGGGNGQMNEHVEFTVKVSCFVWGGVMESPFFRTIVRREPVGFEKLWRLMESPCTL